MSALNRMPGLKMRARNIYFALLATPAGAAPKMQVAADKHVMLPPALPEPNPLCSPLEHYSRQLVVRRK